ncbi:MAG: methyltransferase domain-containing protein, partial [Planctomycetes bacterium]|nr:methyltransferase domain-containing protein [Planctomycetota bacterium]
MVCATANQLPIQKHSVDLVLLLDVLYHQAISSDTGLLKAIHDVLKPQSLLLITDSACPWLYSAHDRAMHGRERYSIKGLREKVRGAGYSILEDGYFNFLLFPFAVAQRLLSRKSAAVSVSTPPKLLNEALYKIFSSEAAFLGRIRFPLGLSVYCVAKTE